MPWGLPVTCRSWPGDRIDLTRADATPAVIERVFRVAVRALMPAQGALPSLLDYVARWIVFATHPGKSQHAEGVMPVPACADASPARFLILALGCRQEYICDSTYLHCGRAPVHRCGRAAEGATARTRSGKWTAAGSWLWRAAGSTGPPKGTGPPCCGFTLSGYRTEGRRLAGAAVAPLFCLNAL
jgi:hypothetical protein